MAYDGYLIKIKGGSTTGYTTDYEFPKNWIAAETFKVITSVQDMDSYRDGQGVLHRNALAHTIYKVEFQTRDRIKASDYNAIMEQITHRYTSSAERKLKIKAYQTESGTYTDWIDAYLPDFDITIKLVDEQHNDLIYKAVRFAFIQY